MAYLKSVILKNNSFKVDGAALQIVIIISLVITILCSCLLLLTYYKSMRYLQFTSRERMENNLKDAITLSLSKTFSSRDTTISDDLFSIDTVRLTQENWGMFDLIKVKVYHGMDTLRKTYLTGMSPEHPKEVIYVVDEDRPLSITGKSKITGDAMLPKAGITTSYVNGKFYEQNKPLIYGKQQTSSRSLPAIDEAALAKIFKDLKAIKDAKNNEPDSNLNSFFLATRVVSGKVLKINKSYDGKIIFVADSLIEIGKDARLENVLIYAPVVRFLAGNESIAQVFARDSVILGNSCKLNYPSAICMFRDKAKKDEFSKIVIADDCTFEGTILARGLDNNYLKYILTIGKKSTIKGLVDIDGTFSYSTPANFQTCIRTKRLVCSLGGLLYENYIVDLKLDIEGRPESFLSSKILERQGSKQVLKWLN